MNKNPQETTYRTSDLYLAAFLKVSGVIMEGVVKDSVNPRRKHFVFENTNMVSDLCKAFFNDRPVKIRPKQYAHAVKDLKSLAMSG